MTWKPELPHEKYVERRIERARHFGRDRNTPSRQCEHNHVVAAFVLFETCCQLDTRLLAVREQFLTAEVESHCVLLCLVRSEYCAIQVPSDAGWLDGCLL